VRAAGAKRAELRRSVAGAEPGAWDGPVLSAHGLALRRGGRAVLSRLDLLAAPGEALLLTGRNGAGKSSTLRALAGLLRPAAGAVRWNGEDVAEDPAAHARRLRWLGHADAAPGAFTAAEELRFHARLHGAADPAAAIGPALAALGLAPLASLPVRALSQGQRRRLALARLLLRPAPLWLLDEPSSGLDAASVSALAPVFAAHLGRGGIVVAATHLPLPIPGARALRL